MDPVTIMNELINENPYDYDPVTAVALDELTESLLNNQVEEPVLEENVSKKLKGLNSDEASTEENTKENEEPNPDSNDQATRPCQFALNRIKTIMKLDPDLSLTSKESVFLIAKATVNNKILEIFLFKNECLQILNSRNTLLISCQKKPTSLLVRVRVKHCKKKILVWIKIWNLKDPSVSRIVKNLL